MFLCTTTYKNASPRCKQCNHWDGSHFFAAASRTINQSRCILREWDRTEDVLKCNLTLRRFYSCWYYYEEKPQKSLRISKTCLFVCLFVPILFQSINKVSQSQVFFSKSSFYKIRKTKVYNLIQNVLHSSS